MRYSVVFSLLSKTQLYMYGVFFIFILYGLGELIIGAIQVINALVNGYSYHTICGTFYNPAPYSIVIVLIFPFACFFAFQWKELMMTKSRILKKVGIFLSVCYVAMSLLVLPFTMSRVSWLAAIITFCIIVYKHIKENKNATFCLTMTKKIWCIVILTAFSVMGLWEIYSLKKDSADGRLLIWKISSSVVKKHFIVGTGKGYFPGAYGEAQEEYFRTKTGTAAEKYLAGAPEFAYNEYIQITAEYGIVGLMFIILFVSYCFYHLGHINNPDKTPIMGAFISLLIISFFSYPFRNFYTCILSICVIALVILISDKKQNRRIMFVKYALVHLALFGVFYKVCFTFGFLGDVKAAYNQWSMLSPYYEAEQFDEIVPHYSVLYPYLKTDVPFLFEYGQCLSKTKQYGKSNSILYEGLCRSSDPMFLNIIGKNCQRLGNYELAEKMFYKAHYRIPHKLYPLYLLMELYREQRREKDMLTMAYRIVTQKEKIESLEMQYIKNKAKQVIECHKAK